MRTALAQHFRNLHTALLGRGKLAHASVVSKALTLVIAECDEITDRAERGDRLYDQLIRSIKRRKGQMAFADDVVTMLDAIQAYEKLRD